MLFHFCQNSDRVNEKKCRPKAIPNSFQNDAKDTRICVSERPMNKTARRPEI